MVSMLRASLAAGVTATVCMDLSRVLLGRLGLGSGLPPASLGRWLGWMAKGRFRHEDIMKAPPIPGEMPIGVLAHFCIGIMLAAIYLWVMQKASANGLAPARGTWWTALAYGTATNMFPWLLMMPMMGYGLLGRSAPAEWSVTRVSGAIHVFYGLGLGLWCLVLSRGRG